MSGTNGKQRHPEIPPRIGVYVCDCGINIAGKVDCPAVTEFANRLPNVIVSREYKFMCSDPGQEIMRDDIDKHNLNRIVVASCSPLMHEATFRKTCADAGINPFYFQMANIREHVSWVTKDANAATDKAKSLVAAAVYRVKNHEPLEKKRMSVRQEVVVVGAGIAGIHAALTLANAGKRVYLIEREPTIGGHMAQFDKTFPTLDCSACILTPKMSDVKNHPLITLWTMSEVVNVEGYAGNFKVKIKHKPRYIVEEDCVGCLLCVEQCIFKPKFDDEFNAGLCKRKPVYMPFPQATPPVVVIDPTQCLMLTRGKCKQTCVDACEKKCIDFNQTETYDEVECGAIILSTGFKVFDATRIPRYGYGKYDGVYTSLEIERLVNAAGPTGGELIMRNGQRPKSVGIVHCTGSRDRKTNAYCSRVCCMYSLKLAHLVKERSGAEVYNFYIDMRTPGKNYDEFYDRLLEEQVHFIRGRVAEVSDWSMSPEEQGKLVIRVEDTLVGVPRRIPVDMVILSVGLEPQTDSDDVRRLFGISCNHQGWFSERHPKLAPVSTATDGIFLAGCCQGPKDIPDTVAQAGAAACETMAMVSKGYVELEPNTAHINAELCCGCRTCISMCPYSAIKVDKTKEGEVSVVNEALCKGCGTCVAACPSAAIQQHLFTDDQIFDEIEGILNYV